MSKRLFLTASTAAFLLLALCLPHVSVAHEGATGVVKERMEAMKEMERRMKTMAEMLKGSQKLEFRHIETSARQIAGHAQKIQRLFPVGSDKHPSTALPSVWAKNKQFAQSANELTGKAMKLSTKARTKKRIVVLPAFSEVAKACKACHDNFRKRP